MCSQCWNCITGVITNLPVKDGHLPVSDGVDALKTSFPLVYQTRHIFHRRMRITHPCIVTVDKNIQVKTHRQCNLTFLTIINVYERFQSSYCTTKNCNSSSICMYARATCGLWVCILAALLVGEGIYRSSVQVWARNQRWRCQSSAVGVDTPRKSVCIFLVSLSDVIRRTLLGECYSTRSI